MVEETFRICVRQADAADAGALAELRAASLCELGEVRPLERPSFVDRARRELWSALREERLAAWILEVDGRPTGCVAVLFWHRLPYPGTSLHAEIGSVYVAPEHRGRGYARELISEALATAYGRGARRVVLQPSTGAETLYRNFGFTPTGQLRFPA